MVKRDLRTRAGRIRALGVDAAVVDGACELAIGACERGAIHGEVIELAGRAAYFKKEPLRGQARARHGLRGASTTQKAVDGLVKQEIVAKDGGFVRIAEPFYAEWIRGRGLLSVEG